MYRFYCKDSKGKKFWVCDEYARKASLIAAGYHIIRMMPVYDGI